MNKARAYILSLMILGATVPGCSSEKDLMAPEDQANMAPAGAVFFWAAKGDVKKLKALLATDPGLKDVTGPRQTAPLHAAAAWGQNEAVKYLLEQGADPMVEDENGNTPLNAALTKHHKDTAKILQSAMNAKGGGAEQ